MSERPHPSIIPSPAQLREGEGHFALSAETPIVAHGEAASKAAEALNARLEQLHGLSLPVVEATAAPHIELALSDTEGESYTLSVTPEGVRASGGAAGLYYAAQTIALLYQGGTLPALEIADAPRFGWRGLHLDVSRHFFGVETVKRLIDVMALFKLNTFHWHLTDDQGWRAEIKKYPRLTEVGAWREQTLIGHHHSQPWAFDGTPHGGFYTQDEMREVVRYAQERHITVVPEIDMPGHMQAAIAAYPELGNFGQSDGVRQVWDISTQVLSVREESILFMQDVLSELLDIFPSTFIHVGGDECPKQEWRESEEMQARIGALGLKDEHELQSYFMRRMDAFLSERGRRLIGWDEILEGGLAPGATVMSWRGVKGGIQAAQAGHDVVMTPGSHLYFDHYQSEDHQREPLAIGGHTSLARVYSFEPIPAELTPAEARHVLGVQANTWTEYIPDAAQLEYMMFPRALALAEVAWSPPEKNEADFLRRLPTALAALKKLGVNHREPATRGSEEGVGA